MPEDSAEGENTPRPEQRQKLPDGVLRELKARLKAASNLSTGAVDKRCIAHLMRFYNIRALKTMDARVCAPFLRDVEDLLLASELAESLPPLEVPDVPQAKILPRATTSRIERIRRNVPDELVNLDAWVAANRSPRVLKSGLIKSSKVPLNPHTGTEAKSNDPGTWGTFEKAASHALGRIDCFGVGMNLLGSDYLGLDLDDVIDTNGQLNDRAASFLELLPQTYTEVSPSGRGLRLFFRGRKPAGLKRSARRDAFGAGCGLEVYDGNSGARYLTVTGQLWNDGAVGIASVTEADLVPIVEALAPSKARRKTTARTQSQDSNHEKSQQDNTTDNSDVARARWGLLDARLLDPDQGYEVWFRVLVALKPLGEVGLDLAIAWSKTSCDFDEQEIRDKWPGIDGSGIGSLFGMFDDAAPTWRRDFERAHPGACFQSDTPPGTASGRHEIGQRHNGRLILSTQRTMPTAVAFVREFHLHNDGRTLHCVGSQFYAWNGRCYEPAQEQALRNQIQRWLHDAWTLVARNNGFELVPFPANSTTIRQALDAIRDYTHLPADTQVPSWLNDDGNRPKAEEFLPCRSSMLHIPRRTEHAPSPALFTTCALDFDYDADAPTPARFLEFLDEIFDHDVESIRLLQEWIGYLLTAETSQQKILLMVGPRRSGKGTLARVIHKLIGSKNVASPTTVGLAGTFGLQPLIGKSVAIVSDARFHGDGVKTVVERLLCISGEDSITIDRKYLGAVTMKLPTRFMILSNEIPRLSDTSTALAGRFLILKLCRSFYGQEDTGLTDKLLAELPGILRWALDGWERLHERGRFVEPSASTEAAEEMEDLASPMHAFIRDCCVAGPGQRVDVDDIFSAWRKWCQYDGRTLLPTKQTFGRDLKTVLPHVKRRRGNQDVPFYEGVGLRQ